MTQRFAAHGYTVSLRDHPKGGHEVVAVKGVMERKPGRTWLNVVLFLATLLSVLFIGAQYALQDANLLTDPNSPTVLTLILTHLHWGIPFAATLLGILLAHELSHYFVARRYGSPVSLPFFIPMPASLMGTMGAVIVQRAPMRDRKALFDIAWAGLLVTMINLIPVGQLDGGHVSYALLGRHARTAGYAAIAAMIGWGGWLLMNGNQAGGFWLTWSFLNLILNPRHPPPLDDATRLDAKRIALGLLVLAIFILTFMPAPLREIQLR
jgi:membrane-associated protease RseP (regulator of RpoE activity)